MSYSRKDEAVMRRVATYLRNQGVNVWVDNEKLIPGTPIWETEIEKAITGASAVIVILSPDSKKSEWMRREMSFAEQYDKRIFPLLVRGDEDSSISIRLITSQYVDLRKDEISGLNLLHSALAHYLDELEDQNVIAQNVSWQVVNKQVEKKPFHFRDFVKTNRQTLRNIARAFGIILVGTLLYGGGDWLGYSVSTKTQYTFVAWIPPLLGILFGPIVGGTTALAGDLLYQLSFHWKDPTSYFLYLQNRPGLSLDQLRMSSHLLSVIFASLIVKDTRNWKKNVLAGLIILSIPQLISIWSEFSLQFSFKEDNWEWYDSLKNMLLDMWVLRTLIPNLVIFSLLLPFATNKLNQYKWYNDFRGTEKMPADLSPRKFIFLMATGWAVAFAVTFGFKDVRSVLVPAFVSINDRRQVLDHAMSMTSFPVDIFLACGILCSLIYAYIVRTKFKKLEWYHLITMVLGWMIGIQLSMKAYNGFLGFLGCFGVTYEYLLYIPVGGFFGGFFSSLPVLWINTRNRLLRIFLIAISWCIGLFFGFLFPPYPYICDMSQTIRFIISGFLAGSIGALGTALAIWNLNQDS